MDKALYVLLIIYFILTDLKQKSYALNQYVQILHIANSGKRIAAALFICFLKKNSILLNKSGARRIDDNALVALTIMIASSKSSEKDIMVKVILN